MLKTQLTDNNGTSVAWHARHAQPATAQWWKKFSDHLRKVKVAIAQYQNAKNVSTTKKCRLRLRSRHYCYCGKQIKIFKINFKNSLNYFYQ